MDEFYLIIYGETNNICGQNIPESFKEKSVKVIRHAYQFVL